MSNNANVKIVPANALRDEAERANAIARAKTRYIPAHKQANLRIPLVTHPVSISATQETKIIAAKLSLYSEEQLAGYLVMLQDLQASGFTSLKEAYLAIQTSFSISSAELEALDTSKTCSFPVKLASSANFPQTFHQWDAYYRGDWLTGKKGSDVTAAYDLWRISMKGPAAAMKFQTKGNLHGVRAAAWPEPGKLKGKMFSSLVMKTEIATLDGVKEIRNYNPICPWNPSTQEALEPHQAVALFGKKLVFKDKEGRKVGKMKEGVLIRKEDLSDEHASYSSNLPDVGWCVVEGVAIDAHEIYLGERQIFSLVRKGESLSLVDDKKVKATLAKFVAFGGGLYIASLGDKTQWKEASSVLTSQIIVRGTTPLSQLETSIGVMESADSQGRVRKYYVLKEGRENFVMTTAGPRLASARQLLELPRHWSKLGRYEAREKFFGSSTNGGKYFEKVNGVWYFNKTKDSEMELAAEWEFKDGDVNEKEKEDNDEHDVVPIEETPVKKEEKPTGGFGGGHVYVPPANTAYFPPSSSSSSSSSSSFSSSSSVSSSSHSTSSGFQNTRASVSQPRDEVDLENVTDVFDPDDEEPSAGGYSREELIKLLTGRAVPLGDAELIVAFELGLSRVAPVELARKYSGAFNEVFQKVLTLVQR